MATAVSVAVLVSSGRHPVSGQARACRSDAVALALGRRIAGESVHVIHAGDPHDAALQDYLALGAARIGVVPAASGSDICGALAAQLAGVDLILTGSRTEYGPGSGLLPYSLAHALGRPVIADVLSVEIGADEVRIRQFLPKGRRRTIAAALPLVLAVHPSAVSEMPYAHARRLAGRIEVLGVEPIESQPPTVSPATVAPRRLVPLTAEAGLDGHARMLSYVQSQAKGGAVAFEGSSVDKAQILLTYLREHQLVDF